MRLKSLAALAVAAALPTALTACGSDSSEAAGTIEYWLWDSNQLPAYQDCARAFEQSHQGMDVKITQIGYEDYWGRLTTAVVSETAPDVFTNHVSIYPDFATKGQIVPLDDYIEQDNVDVGAYPNGLAELWVAEDGQRYGLPKDWDTTGIFYNKDMLTKAGISEQQMQNLTWNPRTGGTYEDVIAHLTVDESGTRGDEPGFDKNNVAVYGLGLENSGSGIGQTQWAMYAGTTGWRHTDKPTWATHYNYDDPRFQQTIAWWRGLIEKGYMPTLEAATSGLAVNDAFGAGKAALNTNGDWMIREYYGYKGIDAGVAPTPIGPNGQRASMFNGLADSIYAGTDNPDGSWEWVKFLASAECQKIVARHAVVFPALPEATEIAAEEFQKEGVDVDAFTTHVENDSTFLYPITEQAAEVDAIMAPAMDAVVSGDAPVSSLTQANQQVNALFR